MARDWIKPVAVADVQNGKLYFVGLKPKWKYGVWQFWSEYLNGKTGWSIKPGIAMQCKGGDKLRKLLTEKASDGVIAIEVPKDADKRWRARKEKQPCQQTTRMRRGQ